MSRITDAIKDAMSILHPAKVIVKPIRLFDTIEQELELEILKIYMQFFVDFRAAQLQGQQWLWNWRYSIPSSGYGIGFSQVELIDYKGDLVPVMSFEEFNMWFQEINVR